MPFGRKVLQCSRSTLNVIKRIVTVLAKLLRRLRSAYGEQHKCWGHCGTATGPLPPKPAPTRPRESRIARLKALWCIRKADTVKKGGVAAKQGREVCARHGAAAQPSGFDLSAAAWCPAGQRLDSAVLICRTEPRSSQPSSAAEEATLTVAAADEAQFRAGPVGMQRPYRLRTHVGIAFCGDNHSRIWAAGPGVAHDVGLGG